MTIHSQLERWETKCLNRLVLGQDAVFADEPPVMDGALGRALGAGLQVCRTRAQVRVVFEAARYLAPYAPYLERHNPYHAPDGKFAEGPHKTKSYRSVRQEKIEDLKAWVRTQPNEYGYAVSRDTGEVVKEKPGTTEGVNFYPEELVGHRDVAILHSHPNVVALSPEDWKHLIDTPNISEVTAVTQQYAALALKPPFWRKPRDNSVPDDVEAEWRRIFRQVAYPYFTGEKSLDEMDSVEESRVTIEVNKQMAKKYRIIFHVDHHKK